MKVVIPSKEQERQAKKFNVNPLIIHLLALRNVVTDEDINNFLNPSLTNLPEPFVLKGMTEAVDLVVDAIRNNREILVWGDYDVDGITATCLLVKFFKKLGKEVQWHIPDRFNEGYGINSGSLKDIRLKLQGDFPLLITVDCGISNHKEILEAKELGFRVVVTDHHEPPERRVAADAIINVKQKGCNFPDTNLAGVGTAFYLAAGIRSTLRDRGYFQDESTAPNLKYFLDYVAIGTIADMVPLTGSNRILVKAGFESLLENGNIGLAALLQSSDISPGLITSDDISFQIAPKINAAGRLGKVEAAMNLLLCTEQDKARKLANTLTDINVRRKKICEDILETTLNIDRNILICNDNCIILFGEFHSGVIGIVASQLANIHHLPTLIFAPDPSDNKGNTLKGSGRSVPGVDLMEILRYCERYLLKYGGHTMAAGMSLYRENLTMFKECFSSYLSDIKDDISHKSQLAVDAELSIENAFDNTFLHQLYKLEPFGTANARPVFSDPAAFIYDYQLVGKNGDHIKLFFRGKYTNCQGIGFNLGARSSKLQDKRNHTVIYSPILNRFKTRTRWEVRLLDIL